MVMKKTRKIIDCLEATEKNYATEYDDYICNIKVVDDIEEAIEHIYNYSTKHSESIITENKETAKYFMGSLDSACVYHNASTRFSDGGEFGFGAKLVFLHKSFMLEAHLVYRKLLLQNI